MNALLLCILVATQDTPGKQARELIERLRSPKIEDRVEAEKQLRELGRSAEAVLELATRDKDPEVASRARGLLVEKTPEGTLRRIEDSLVSGKTASLKFHTLAQRRGKPDETLMSATLLLKQGNRASLIDSRARRLCDGLKMRSLHGPGNESERDAPKNLRDGLALVIARVGLTPTIIYAFGLADSGGLDEAFQEMVRTSKVEAVQFGEGDGDAGTLHYRVSFPDFGKNTRTASIRLWYDPKTLKVLKRSIEVGPGGTLWETYSEWVINGEIPDEAFKGVDERIADYARKIEKDGRNSDSYLGRAQARADKGDRDGAIEDYTRSIELSPNVVVAYVGRGTVRMWKDDLNGAAEDFTKAIEIEPSVVAHYLSRSKARRLKSDHDGVIKDCERVLELDPKSLEALLERGKALCFKEKFVDAIADFNRAEQLGARMTTFTSYRALALAGAGKDKEAVEQVERAFQVDLGGLHYAYVARGLAMLHLGRKEEALADFAQFEYLALERDPLLPLVIRWKNQAGSGK